MGTLLLIDDSASVRAEVLRVLREKGGFERFLEAENGLAGLKVLAQEGQGVDVILCDLNMPLMDGFKFLRAAKADARVADIPAVMLTAESEANEVVKAFELGAYDYITKPFTPGILRARLSAMLRIKQLQDQLKAQKEQLERMATTDALTGVPNVRYFRKALEDEVSRSKRYGHPLSLVMCDLDHFKKVNDTYGHPAGDAVLVAVAETIQAGLRRVDLVARYGGEEFVLILPHTPADQAVLVADRIRASVEEKTFPGSSRGIRLTLSLGVSHRGEQADLGAQELVDQADQALYLAKESGRNRVIPAWSLPPKVPAASSEGG